MSRPVAGAQALPFVRPVLHRAMMKVAADIGGPIDLQPHKHLVGTENAVLLAEANLLIMGTSTACPVGLYDFDTPGVQHAMDVLLMRFDGRKVTFDIRLHRADEWLEHYDRCYWEGQFRFRPIDDENLPIINASRRGLVLSQNASLANLRRYDAGFGSAAVAADAAWKKAA